MKDLNTYITEKLKIRKSNNPSYKYFPKTKDELQDLLKQLIEERGNEGNFNDIDTSKITDMSELFADMDKFNGNISNWNVSNVTSMSWMFGLCDTFNQDISNWNVSNVEYISNMFFNCPIKEKYKPNFT